MDNLHEAARVEEVREDVIIAYQEVMNKLKVMKGANNNNDFQKKHVENDIELHEEEIFNLHGEKDIVGRLEEKYEEKNEEKHEVKNDSSVEPNDEKYQEKCINENIVELARETPDNIAKNFADLKLSFTKTLDDLRGKMIEKQEEFSILDKAIIILKEELSNLYQIKDTVNAMQALIIAKKDKEASLEREFAEFKRSLETEKMRMEKERAREQSEYVQKRDVIRRREQEQYEINKRELYDELYESRRKLDEEYEAREAALDARETEHKQLKDREAKIMAREQEYNRLREREAKHPEELKAAVSKAEAAIRDQLNKKASYDIKVLEIGYASEKTLLVQKVEALQLQLEQYKALKDLYSE